MCADALEMKVVGGAVEGVYYVIVEQEMKKLELLYYFVCYIGGLSEVRSRRSRNIIDSHIVFPQQNSELLPYA